MSNICQSFLQRVSAQLVDKYGDQLGEVLLVLPNRRAILFLQQHLASFYDAPIWSPKMMTTDDIVLSVSKFVTADRLTLIHLLNKVREQITGSKESLESFYFWGNQLLSDFDDADKHLAPIDQLFAYITDMAEIDMLYGDLEEELRERLVALWGLREKPNHKFGETWKNLGNIYAQFNSTLKKKGIGYKGMIYREVAEHPELLNGLVDTPIVVIGFNRLDKAQKAIFKYFQRQGETNFYWQDHPVLIKDKVASRFILENQKTFPNELVKLDAYQRPESIEIVPVSGRSNQAQVVGHYISKVDYSEEQIACILPEESILQPLLKSLPKKIDQINVTLGLPLKETQAYTLIESFISLHLSAQRTFGHFSRKDLERLIRHPYLSIYFQPGGGNEIKLVNPEGAPFHYITRDQIDLTAPLQALLFKPLENEVHGIIRRLISILSEAYEMTYAQEVSEYHLEILMKSHGQMKRLYDIVLQGDMEFTVEGILQVIRNIFRMARVPFKGEPLRGMQVMGPLEAQNLDFEFVAITSMNEGIYPIGFQDSYIPSILRKVFGMPLQDDTAAEYAYYFWSSILPAKKVLLCYDTDQGGVGAKEASRLIQQLKMQFDHWPIKLQSISKEYPVFQETTVVVKKDDAINDILQRKASVGFSPTNINDYALCSLKFYLKHIAGIKEPQLGKSAAEPQIIGLVLHDVLERLYQPFLNISFKEASKKALLEQVPELVDEYMRLHLKLPDQMTENGYAYLVRGIIIKYVEIVINYDTKNNDFMLRGLEDKHQNTSFKLSNGTIISLKGTIDRWEQRGDRLMVVDYKTGGYKLGGSGSKKTDVQSMEALFGHDKSKKQPKEALQSLIYSWMLGRQEAHLEKKIDAALYFVRAMGEAGHNPMVISKQSKKSIVDDIDFNENFEGMLIGLLEEIIDPNIPFTMTEDEDVCRYCPYNVHCDRT